MFSFKLRLLKNFPIFLHFLKKILKKLLQFLKFYGIIAELHNVYKIHNIDAKVLQGGVISWQSAVFVEKVLFSVRMFLTLTVRPTELGSPIFVRLRQ